MADWKRENEYECRIAWSRSLYIAKVGPFLIGRGVHIKKVLFLADSKQLKSICVRPELCGIIAKTRSRIIDY